MFCTVVSTNLQLGVVEAERFAAIAVVAILCGAVQNGTEMLHVAMIVPDGSDQLKNRPSEH